MCIVKMVDDSYLNYSSIFNLVNYALIDKCTQGRVRFYGGYNVDIDRAASQMVLVKKYYQKDDKREMRHFVVSFVDDISPYDAWILGWRIAAYYADRYQVVFGVHKDTDNPHIHFVSYYTLTKTNDRSLYIGAVKIVSTKKPAYSLPCSEDLDNMDIGTRLRVMRLRAGFTIEQAARAVGVGRRCVMDYELGRVKRIKPTVLEKLLRLYCK